MLAPRRQPPPRIGPHACPPRHPPRPSLPTARRGTSWASLVGCGSVALRLRDSHRLDARDIEENLLQLPGPRRPRVLRPWLMAASPSFSSPRAYNMRSSPSLTSSSSASRAWTSSFTPTYPTAPRGSNFSQNPSPSSCRRPPSTVGGGPSMGSS